MSTINRVTLLHSKTDNTWLRCLHYMQIERKRHEHVVAMMKDKSPWPDFAVLNAMCRMYNILYLSVFNCCKVSSEHSSHQVKFLMPLSGNHAIGNMSKININGIGFPKLCLQ